MPKRALKIIVVFSVLTIAACALFVLWGLNKDNMDYNLPRRMLKIAAFVLTGSAIGVSTIVFQTITQNRILTPGIIGLDSLYVFIQTLIVFILGSGQLVMMSRISDFLISLGVMVIFSLILFKVIFRGEGRQITTIILAGMICGSLFGSLSTYMQVIIDPNEFLLVQGRMFASFNRINSSLLGVSAIIIILCLIYLFSCHKKLDVMSLGRDISLNLGIDYDTRVTRFMIFIAMLTAVSTALVGPVTFLGLITANLSHQLLKTYRHSILMVGAMLASVFALAIGQFFTERVFNFGATITVIINFIGGVYFIILMLREGKK